MGKGGGGGGRGAGGGPPIQRIRSIISRKVRSALVSGRDINIDNLRIRVRKLDNDYIFVEGYGRMPRPVGVLRHRSAVIESLAFTRLRDMWKREGLTPEQALRRLRR